MLTVPHGGEREVVGLGAQQVTRFPAYDRSTESVASGYVVGKYDSAAQQRLSRWLPENYHPLVTGAHEDTEALVRSGAVRNALMGSWMIYRDHLDPERLKAWLPENYDRLIVPVSEREQVRAREGAVYNGALKSFFVPKNDIRAQMHCAQWLPKHHVTFDVPAGQESVALKAGAILDHVLRHWVFKEHELPLHPEVKPWVSTQREQA